MRLMATNHIVLETGHDRYSPTPFSWSLGDKKTLIAPGLRIRYADLPSRDRLGHLDTCLTMQPQDRPCGAVRDALA